MELQALNGLSFPLTKVRPKGHTINGEPAPDNGYITLSDAPGFGIDLERDLLVRRQMIWDTRSRAGSEALAR
jgi:L-alanine-DL-glutamate epimerase-like enolase superfamily enzyme